MIGDFKNKNILVTGSAKGIGRLIALTLAKAGANIAIHYNSSEEDARTTMNDIESLGVKATTISCDISVSQEVIKMKDAINEQFGTIDYIVNNAAYAQMKTFFDYDVDEWQKEIDVCLNGVINLAHTFIPDMINNNSGKFINIVGDSARIGDRHLVISAAARSGAIGFIKSLADEVGKYNIQCNTVSLGVIEQQELKDSIKDKLIKRYSLKRLGKPEDVTGMIKFMLSDDASWITGQVYSVNGGFIKV